MGCVVGCVYVHRRLAQLQAHHGLHHGLRPLCAVVLRNGASLQGEAITPPLLGHDSGACVCACQTVADGEQSDATIPRGRHTGIPCVGEQGLNKTPKIHEGLEIQARYNLFVEEMYVIESTANIPGDYTLHTLSTFRDHNVQRRYYITVHSREKRVRTRPRVLQTRLQLGREDQKSFLFSPLISSARQSVNPI